jgi:hypothetical protein
MYMLQAAKAYEDHCAQNGRPDSHAKAKEVLYVLFCVCRGDMYTHLRYSAGLAGAIVDREVETKGVSDLKIISS